MTKEEKTLEKYLTASKKILSSSSVECLALTAKSGVFTDGKFVLKFFLCPYRENVYKTETSFYELAAIHDLPAVPLASNGIYEDAPYTVSGFSKGAPLHAAVKELSEESRLQLAEKTENLRKRMQSVSSPVFGALYTDGPRYDDWVSLLQAGIEDGKKRLVDHDLYPSDFGKSFDLFFKGFTDSDLWKSTKPALVHGDLCEKNMFIEESDGQFNICGMIDFENACYADPLYEMPRVDDMYTRLRGGKTAQNAAYDNKLLLFYKICDYVMHIHNVLLTIDTGFDPYFHGRFIKYPDCEPAYIENKLIEYTAQMKEYIS